MVEIEKKQTRSSKIEKLDGIEIDKESVVEKVEASKEFKEAFLPEHATWPPPTQHQLQ